MLKQTRAAELRDYAISLGWEVSATRSGTARKMVCDRSRYTVLVEWDDTRLIVPSWLEERNYDGAVIKRSQIATMKQVRELLELHSVGEREDEAILDSFRGKRIYWRNSISGEIQDATVSRYGNHYRIGAGKNGRKFIEFCDAEGFHAVHLDSIIKTRRAAA